MQQIWSFYYTKLLHFICLVMAHKFCHCMGFRMGSITFIDMKEKKIVEILATSYMRCVDKKKALKVENWKLKT